MRVILEVIWFILPAGFANMAPLFAARIAPRWDNPVDGGLTLGGVRIFGDHKTVRGLVAGVLLATLVFLAQRAASERWEDVRALGIIDYGSTPAWFGALLGAGALGGDLVKSFFKRRRGRTPGASWFPFDQLDWVAGALAATCPFARPGIVFVLVALGTCLLLSIAVKALGYLLGIERTPF